MFNRRQHGDAADAAHGIDLAPMLDFVTNLLIFFIITAVFLKESTLTVNRPDASTSKSEQTATSIQLLASGEILFDNLAVDVRAVRARVERVKALDPQRGVMIVAQETAPTGTVVEVADQVRLAGIRNITFTTAQ